MTVGVCFFPVGNGDMTLIELESGRTILIDVNIRAAADDPDDPIPDVAAKLKKRLRRDSQGRPYVDVFCQTHPDQDHCSGLRTHFHLDSPDTYDPESGKILIREIWSSPMVFRRASRRTTLCEDAKAFATEARRRVARFRQVGAAAGDGDRVQIMGRDENGKTDDLEAILVPVDGQVTKVNGTVDGTMVARVLGPLPKSGDEDEEEALAKNRSSIILRFSIMGEGEPDACRFLTGGDAEVAIWDRLWGKHRGNDWLEYDLLQTPHHCSWHSLSYDSWSEMGEDTKVSKPARAALSRTRAGAVLVSSSKAIKDDDSDPPCIRAKREYVQIAGEAGGSFMCTGEYPSEADPDVLEFVIGRDGPRRKARSGNVAPAVIVGAQPVRHG